MKSNTLSCYARFSDKKLLDLIRAHKVIVAPSDTVWGLCGAVSKEVFEKLNELKVRNEKPYLVLASSKDAIREYAELPQDSSLQGLLNAVWPGPVTVIFKALSHAPDYMVGKEGTIAFRVPFHEGLQTLLQVAPLLFSTSANISGKPLPSSFKDVDPAVCNGAAACVVPEGQEEIQVTIPSTIIDVTTGHLRLVREGAVPFKDILEIRERAK